MYSSIYSHRLHRMQPGDKWTFVAPPGMWLERLQQCITGSCNKLWGAGTFHSHQRPRSHSVTLERLQ